MLIWPGPSPLKGLDDETVEAHAPFWLPTPGAQAALMVNNAVLEEFPFTLRLHGLDGSLLHSQEYLARSNDSLTIALSDYLDPSARAGYAVLEYPLKHAGDLPSQMTVASEDERLSASFLFLERGTLPLKQSHMALWLPSPHSDAYLLLLNRSQETLAVTIRAHGEKVDLEQHLNIPAGSVHPIQLREEFGSRLPRQGFAAGLQISHTGGRADLVSEGFVMDARRGISYTLDRYELDPPASANLVYPLLKYGLERAGRRTAHYKPVVAISNGSASRMEVEPLLRPEGGQPVELQGWVLEPFEARVIDLEDSLRRIAAPETLLQGSLELRHSGISGQMAATVLSLDSASGRVIQSKFKPDSQLSLAYSYPFRLSEGWSTRLYVTNRTSEQVELCVFLHFEGRHYTWFASKFLEPHEMRVIDIGELRDSQTMDEFGRLIPEDVDSGQFKLVIHSKDRSLVTAQAVIENAELGLAFSTSCEICPPASLWLFLRKNRFDPEGTVAFYQGLPGQKERIYAVVQNEHGSTKDVSGWADYTSSNSSVASIKRAGGRADVEMNGSGFAALGASIFECIFYAPSFECEEGGCPCECQQDGFLTVPGSGLFGAQTSPAAQVLVNSCNLAIDTPANNQVFRLDQLSTRSVDIPLRASSICPGPATISWDIDWTYSTSGGRGPFNRSASLFSTLLETFNLSTSEDGGRATITASTTLGGDSVNAQVQVFVVGDQIPDQTITNRLVALYNGPRGRLLTGMAMKESSYRQFATRTLFGISDRWPLESFDGGSHIGLLQVVTNMQRAFDWHTNTQFARDLFADKLQIVVNREANTRAQNPGLRVLTDLERELDALVLYGPFSGTASQHYHVPNAGGTDWIVNTAGNPQGVAYANDVVSLMR